MPALECLRCRTQLKQGAAFRCQHCTVHPAHYCGVKCQRQHWRVHKHVCQRTTKADEYLLGARDAQSATRISKPIGANGQEQALSGDDTDAQPGSKFGNPFYTPDVEQFNKKYSTARETQSLLAKREEEQAAVRAELARLEQLLSKLEEQQQEVPPFAGIGQAESQSVEDLRQRIEETKTAIEASKQKVEDGGKVLEQLRTQLGEEQKQLRSDRMWALREEYDRLIQVVNYRQRREEIIGALDDELNARTQKWDDGSYPLAVDRFSLDDVERVENYVDGILGSRESGEGLLGVTHRMTELAEQSVERARDEQLMSEEQANVAEQTLRSIEELVESKLEFARAPTDRMRRRIVKLQRQLTIEMVEMGRALDALPDSTPRYSELGARRLDEDVQLATLQVTMEVDRATHFGSDELTTRTQTLLSSMRELFTSSGNGEQQSESTEDSLKFVDELAEYLLTLDEQDEVIKDQRQLAEELQTNSEQERRREVLRKIREQEQTSRRAAANVREGKRPTTGLVPLEPGVTIMVPPVAKKLIGANGDGEKKSETTTTTTLSAADTSRELIDQVVALVRSEPFGSAVEAIRRSLNIIEDSGLERTIQDEPLLGELFRFLRDTEQFLRVVSAEEIEAKIRNKEDVGKLLRDLLQQSSLWLNGRVGEQANAAIRRRWGSVLTYTSSTWLKTLALGVLLASRFAPGAQVDDIRRAQTELNALVVETPVEFVPSVESHVLTSQDAVLIDQFDRVEFSNPPAIALEEDYNALLDADRERLTDARTDEEREARDLAAQSTRNALNWARRRQSPGDQNRLEAAHHIAANRPHLESIRSLDAVRQAVREQRETGEDFTPQAGQVQLSAGNEFVKRQVFRDYVERIRTKAVVTQSDADVSFAELSNLLRSTLRFATEREDVVGTERALLEEVSNAVERSDELVVLEAALESTLRIESQLATNLQTQRIQSVQEEASVPRSVTKRLRGARNFIQVELRPSLIQASDRLRAFSAARVEQPDNVQLIGELERQLLSARASVGKNLRTLVQLLDADAVARVELSGVQRVQEELSDAREFLLEAQRSARATLTDEERERLFSRIADSETLDRDENDEEERADGVEMSALPGARLSQYMATLHTQLIELLSSSEDAPTQLLRSRLSSLRDTIEQNTLRDVVRITRQSKQAASAEEVEEFTRRELQTVLSSLSGRAAHYSLASARVQGDILPSVVNLLADAFDERPTALVDDNELQRLVREGAELLQSLGTHSFWSQRTQPSLVASLFSAEANPSKFNTAFFESVERMLDRRARSGFATDRERSLLERLREKVRNFNNRQQVRNEQVSWIVAWFAFVLPKGAASLEQVLPLVAGHRRDVLNRVSDAFANIFRSMNSLFRQFEQNAARVVSANPSRWPDVALGDGTVLTGVQQVRESVQQQSRNFQANYEALQDRLRRLYDVRTLDAQLRILFDATSSGVVNLASFFTVTQLSHQVWYWSTATPAAAYLTQPFVAYEGTGLWSMLRFGATLTSIPLAHRVLAAGVRLPKRALERALDTPLINTAALAQRVSNARAEWLATFLSLATLSGATYTLSSVTETSPAILWITTFLAFALTAFAEVIGARTVFGALRSQRAI